ncbi:MAG: hypothetical protein ACOYM3_27925, partial [Terrimicrobiaceae bacterium]
DAYGTRAGIVALDLCGIDTETVAGIEEAALEAGVAPELLTINISHNHSAPNFDTTLSLYYEHTPRNVEMIRDYTSHVRRKIQEALLEAAANLEPTELSYGLSLAGFGVNRRRDSERGYSCKALPQVVDHDVPVLAARDSDGKLRSVLFGYACHTTSLCGTDLNGDYAGYACREIESAFPGVGTMFLAGCGADINPLPRFTQQCSQAYGMILAAAVREGVESPAQTLSGALRGSARRIQLETLPAPSLDEITKKLRTASRWGPVMTERIIAFFEKEWADRGRLPSSVPYRVGVLDFGDSLRLIALAGETVVDYQLALKALYGVTRTWVLGYCDALTPYIPSCRVLEEGGYEGCESMPEYGFPMPFTPDVEKSILEAVSACAPDRID